MVSELETTMILEVVHRCPYCKREATVTSQEYAENPYCNACLDERISEASRELGPITWRSSRGYIEIIPASQTVS